MLKNRDGDESLRAKCLERKWYKEENGAGDVQLKNHSVPQNSVLLASSLSRSGSVCFFVFHTFMHWAESFDCCFEQETHVEVTFKAMFFFPLSFTLSGPTYVIFL